MRDARSVLAIAVARAGLRWLRLPQLAGILGVRLGTTRSHASPECQWDHLAPEVAQTLESVDAVMRWWPGDAPCLVRALGSGWLLNDLEPTLRIGVSLHPSKSPWVAHAWLEIAGSSLPEPHSATKVSRLKALGRA